MDRTFEMSDDGQVLRGDPECTYKFLEARVAPDIDPSTSVDLACFMTTDAIDADNEVVLPSGADLSRFEKNPVLMLCHAYGQPGCYYPLPIGKVVWTRKRPNGVMAGIAFARSTAIGREIKGLFDEDMVRSFSIGFRSLESSPMTREEARSRPDWEAAFERANGRVLVHRKWSLVELSVAPIPSNEDALRAKYAARGLPVPGWFHLTNAGEVKPMDMPIARGDAVEWTRKGGGRGIVESVHTEGAYPEDDVEGQVVDKDGDGGDAGPELVESSLAEPVARVRCGPGKGSRIKAIHCKHLTRIAGGLPDPDPDPGPDSGQAGAHPEPPGDDEALEEEDGPIRANDHVRINAPHHRGVGLVKSLHRRGLVPDVANDVLGTPDEPAARVKCYKAMGDGFVATEHHVGHLCRHLEKVGPPRPPSRGKSSSRPGPGPGPGPGPLPPLVARPEPESLEEALGRLNQLLKAGSIEQMVRDEVDRRMGCV